MKNHPALRSFKRFFADRRNRTWTVVALIIASILLFYWGFLIHMGTHFKGGDFDQQAQYYEAARISILHYHQFPFWNPWISGGMPLYNNPQYGLISIQSLTTLVFGTFAGLKLAYLTYVFIGFAGMYVLTRRVFNASPLRAILLSYIWIFCGFFSHHGIDHLGFSLLHFLPWLVYFFVKRRERLSWLWFGLILSLMILTSPHYAVLMCCLTIFLLWIWQIAFLAWKKRNLSVGLNFTLEDGRFFGKIALLVIVLSGYRLLGAYEFIKHAPRVASDLYEPANSAFTMLYALFAPTEEIGIPKNLHWSWGEYSGYIGLGAGLAFLVVVVSLLVYVVPRFKTAKGRKTLLKAFHANRLIIFFPVFGLIAFLLSLGNFSALSPMNFLHHLPGFDQTRVASRWILLSIFSILMLLAWWKRYPKVINLFLALSAVELFLLFHFPAGFFGAHTTVRPEYGANFRQLVNPRYDRLMGSGEEFSNKDVTSLYVNTIRNEDSVFTDDPLLNTTVSAPTIRCQDKPLGTVCPLIMTHNAKVSFWSPNKMTLVRTGSGSIELDMNPGTYWLVNGQRITSETSPARSSGRFIIDDRSHVITLEIVPKYSIENLWRILTN